MNTRSLHLWSKTAFWFLINYVGNLTHTSRNLNLQGMRWWVRAGATMRIVMSLSWNSSTRFNSEKSTHPIQGKSLFSYPDYLDLMWTMWNTSNTRKREKEPCTIGRIGSFKISYRPLIIGRGKKALKSSSNLRKTKVRIGSWARLKLCRRRTNSKIKRSRSSRDWRNMMRGRRCNCTQRATMKSFKWMKGIKLRLSQHCQHFNH